MAAVFIVLVGGLTVSTSLYIRAEANRAEADANLKKANELNSQLESERQKVMAANKDVNSSRTLAELRLAQGDEERKKTEAALRQAEDQRIVLAEGAKDKETKGENRRGQRGGNGERATERSRVQGLCRGDCCRRQRLAVEPGRLGTRSIADRQERPARVGVEHSLFENRLQRRDAPVDDALRQARRGRGLSGHEQRQRRGRAQSGRPHLPEAVHHAGGVGCAVLHGNHLSCKAEGQILAIQSSRRHLLVCSARTKSGAQAQWNSVRFDRFHVAASGHRARRAIRRSSRSAPTSGAGGQADVAVGLQPQELGVGEPAR